MLEGGGDGRVGIVGESRSRRMRDYVRLDVDLRRDIDGVELCCFSSQASIAPAPSQWPVVQLWSGSIS